MERTTSDLNRSASSSNFSVDGFQTEKEDGNTQRQGTLRPNKFSFSSLFTPVSTPSTRLGSPSNAPWASRVSSFVGSFFNRNEEKGSTDLAHFTVEDIHSEEAVILSSPETVRVTSPTTLGFEALTGASSSSSPQEVTVPQQSFFQAGDQDQKKFVIALTKKLENARASKDPEEELKKDIRRISYSLNGSRVRDVATIKAFLGEAAENILPILSQTIPNTATDIVVERILTTAPVDTTHAELAMGDSEERRTSISISKKEGSPNIQIEVESRGTPTIFLKKVEQDGTPDFEIITLNREADHDGQPALSGEGWQFISLELTKQKGSSVYSMSCSKLLREYQIKTPEEQLLQHGSK